KTPRRVKLDFDIKTSHVAFQAQSPPIGRTSLECKGFIFGIRKFRNKHHQIKENFVNLCK
ncbi:MAG: hypothetical protein ACPHRD_09910, partial [Paracoccaceae bacterium]